jgi:hypothetical protein
MTIGTALFLALAVFIVCGFGFLLAIYLKEYSREEKTIQKLVEQQEKYYANAGSMPVYVYDMPAPKKTKSTEDKFVIPAEATGKSKKNIN